MKTIIKFAIAATIGLGVCVTTVAQSHLEDPRYGKTPEERTENLKKLNFLRDEISIKNYDDAAIYLKDLMNDAPVSSSNIYLWGVAIYKNKAGRAKSVAEKNIYVDSVLLMYDRRVEYYGNVPNRGRAYILQQKARDYIGLNPLDREGVRGYYKDATDVQGASAEVVVEYFNQLVNDYKGFEVEAEYLLNEYERLSPMMTSADEDNKSKFDSLFASSGAASCENLETLYSKEIAADPNNLELISKAYRMMSMTGCSSDFYVSVAEKYYSLEPSADVAIRLASVFENRHEYTKALKYLNEMIDTDTDASAKSNLYVRIAASELGLKRSSSAAQAARQAISLNSDNGFAYLFLAEAYVAGVSGCSGFHASSVFWLAYDGFARARQAFSGDTAQLSMIDSRMANCRANFPTFEEGFMYIEGYQDGKSYNVNCGWVSGATTIRSR